MELSRKERMAIKAQINDYGAKLDEGTLPRKERMSCKAQINELLAKLDESIELKPEAATQNQKLSDLIAGKYNAEPPEGFLKILKEIIEEINDIEPVKPPTIKYIEVNQDKVNAIMESALGEVFGKLWDQATRKAPENAKDDIFEAVDERSVFRRIADALKGKLDVPANSIVKKLRPIEEAEIPMGFKWEANTGKPIPITRDEYQYLLHKVGDAACYWHGKQVLMPAHGKTVDDYALYPASPKAWKDLGILESATVEEEAVLEPVNEDILEAGKFKMSKEWHDQGKKIEGARKSLGIIVDAAKKEGLTVKWPAFDKYPDHVWDYTGEKELNGVFMQGGDEVGNVTISKAGIATLAMVGCEKFLGPPPNEKQMREQIKIIAEDGKTVAKITTKKPAKLEKSKAA